MKKIVWSVGTLVTLGALCAIFGLSSSTPPALGTLSQKDIQPDQSSPRDLLEFFLSGMGESSLPAIKRQVQEYEQQTQGLLLDGDVFARYVDYKAAVAELSFPDVDGGLTGQAWWQLHQALLELQAQYFTVEQRALFAEENQLRELAIQKRLIYEQYGQNEEAQRAWQALLAEQPDFIQRSEAAAQLLPQLTQAGQGDAQQRYLARVALVGEQGAQRLAELDDSRATFEQQFQHYYQARAAILVRNELSASEQQIQIQQLREQHFAPEQWRRIDALERLKDSGE
ncbi:lipase secretion chaperone [Vibrio metoecus]|uniref:lipase secretion chaperone n=1 Tax=Vibrio metoecus TaxID=1481663 RepID=UPI0006D777B3|nr:lipase secretion chaperone [Vibrio metoecus]KQA20390.1 lipase chaperone [Vibrio metoecus]